MDASISLGQARPVPRTKPAAFVDTDGENLANVPSLDWHASAPRAVLEAAETQNNAGAWKAWSRHVQSAHRRLLAKLRIPGVSRGAKRASLGTSGIWRAFGKRSPLLWGLPAAAEPRRTAALIAMLAGNEPALRRAASPGGAWSQVLTAWLDEIDASAIEVRPRPIRDGVDPANAVRAIEALAWCYALPALVAELPPTEWQRLFEFLVQAANDAAALRLESDPLGHQLWAGELAVALATLFPEIKTSRALLDAGRRALSRGLTDLTNGEGLLSWHDLSIARPLLACWTRSGILGANLNKGSWSAEAANQYTWTVTAALRLMRRDGSQMLQSAMPRTSQQQKLDTDLLRTAVALGGDRSDKRLLATLLGKKAALRPRDRLRLGGWDEKRVAKASYHCEWSGLSMLRPAWERGGTRLALAFGAQQVQIELNLGRDIVLSGAWTAAVSINGESVAATSPWEEACWITNRWMDYVELRQNLADGLVLQRHIVLPREDGFMMLADAVVGHAYRGEHATTNGVAGNGPRPTIQLRTTVPLNAGVEFVPETETREGFLAVDRGGERKNRALVIPLGLPEWRADRRGGTMQIAGSTDHFGTQRGGAIELTQSGRGTSLFAPLFFDLRPKRAAGQRTWRQLTVAEDRKIQPTDRASGFRIQIGHEQWLVYRSLTPRGNRSLLGHNLSTEFLVARFEPTGEVDPLVEVE